VTRADGAELLREARHRAGLTQTELAARAGVTQSVISAYESGHRQPALSTLASLIGATGYVLDVRLRRQPTGLAKLTGPLGRRVRAHRRELLTAARTHGISDLRVFGSVARGEDRSDSDVDLLGHMPPGISLIGLSRATEALERVLGAKVDFVPDDSLKPAVAERIAADLVPL